MILCSYNVKFKFVFAIFESLEDFVSAIEETTFKEPKLRDSIASTWLAVFQKNYKARYGVELNVPKWNDIKDKYDLVTDKKREKAMNSLERALKKLADAQAEYDLFVKIE